MKYYEVTSVGRSLIKNFKSKVKAEKFAQEERDRRMNELQADARESPPEGGYTAGEINGETTYRTHGIIVRQKELVFADSEIKTEEDFTGEMANPWAESVTNRWPPGF